MLAQTFLTAQQLRLSDKEHAALIDVLGRLERGELQHLPWGDLEEGDVAGFNMATFACGSVHCIGGWADRLHGTEFSQVVSAREITQGLWNLLYVEEDGEYAVGELEVITVAQAAEALRNYLTTGKARWADVLGCADA